MSKKPINKKTLLLIEKQNKISMNSGICLFCLLDILKFQNQFVCLSSVAGLVVIIIVVNLSIEKNSMKSHAPPSHR